MRAGVGLFVAAGLAGCACVPPATTHETEKAACPAVRRAEAWVNRMPGPQKPDNALIVVVELETAERWMLRQANAAQSESVLTLELVSGGPGHPGSAGYRAAQSGQRKRVEILCEGKHHYTVNEVTIAY